MGLAIKNSGNGNKVPSIFEIGQETDHRSNHANVSIKIGFVRKATIRVPVRSI